MTRQNATKKKDLWQTPDKLLSNISENIDLDAAAAPDTDIGDMNLTEEDDGLAHDWFGTTFVNPPFTMKSEFLEHAVEQYASGNTDTIYFVTPDSTDTKSWWHKYIAEHADYIWFSKGRIDYIDPETGNADGSATFGTAVSMFGTPPQETLNRFKESGHLLETVK